MRCSANGRADIADRARYFERERPKLDLPEMSGEPKQRCAHYEGQVQPVRARVRAFTLWGPMNAGKQKRNGSAKANGSRVAALAS